jgi:hypothetical protein
MSDQLIDGKFTKQTHYNGILYAAGCGGKLPAAEAKKLIEEGLFQALEPEKSSSKEEPALATAQEEEPIPKPSATKPKPTSAK